MQYLKCRRGAGAAAGRWAQVRHGGAVTGLATRDAVVLQLGRTDRIGSFLLTLYKALSQERACKSELLGIACVLLFTDFFFTT